MTTQITDNKAKIDALLSQLAGETVQANKKKIRRALRALGHRGGLRQKIAATLEAIAAEPEIEIEVDETPVKKPSKKTKK